MNSFYEFATAKLNSRKEAVEKRLSDMEDYISDKEVPNARFLEIKSDINRMFDDAKDGFIDALKAKYDTTRADLKSERGGNPVYNNKISDLSWEFINLAPHTAKNFMKNKVRKLNLPADVYADVETFVEESLVYANKLAELKTYIVKKGESKADLAKKAKKEKEEIKFQKILTSEGMTKVREALEAVTEKEYQSMIKFRMAQIERWVARFFEIDQKTFDEKGFRLTVSDVYNDRRRIYGTQNFSADEATRKLVTVSYNAGAMFQRKENIEAPVKIDNYDEKVLEMATEFADRIRGEFVEKNLYKLASIIDQKGNFKEIKTIGSSVDLSGLTGRFHITFEDGSEFKVMNQVILKMSVLGKLFNQFPLTFHDVVLPSGKKMRNPSEAKMNTEFLGKPAL